jgi:hypothetical protein
MQTEKALCAWRSRRSALTAETPSTLAVAVGVAATDFFVPRAPLHPGAAEHQGYAAGQLCVQHARSMDKPLAKTYEAHVVANVTRIEPLGTEYASRRVAVGSSFGQASVHAHPSEVRDRSASGVTVRIALRGAAKYFRELVVGSLDTKVDPALGATARERQ